MNKPSEVLSDEEQSELSAALSDSFQFYASTHPAAPRPIHRSMDDRFWNLSPQASLGDAESLSSFLALVNAETLTDAEIAARQRAEEDQFEPERVPNWWETSPFNFNLYAVEPFFTDRVAKLADGLDLGDGPVTSRRLIGYFAPLSKAWFECAIAREFEEARWLSEQILRKRSGYDDISAFYAFGALGRMVEHYRWRFTYGADVLRGRSNVQAASSGGRARSLGQRALNLAILTEMSAFVGRGLSVSNAARLAFNQRLGTSPEANRKLWARHGPK